MLSTRTSDVYRSIIPPLLLHVGGTVIATPFLMALHCIIWLPKCDWSFRLDRSFCFFLRQDSPFIAILGNLRRLVVLSSKGRKKPVQWHHPTEWLGLTRISSYAILIFTPVIQICHITSATPLNLQVHDGGVVLCSAPNDVLYVTQSVSETRVISQS